MIAWIGNRLLGPAARAGLQIMDREQRLAMPPRSLAGFAAESWPEVIPAHPDGLILEAVARDAPDKGVQRRAE